MYEAGHAGAAIAMQIAGSAAITIVDRVQLIEFVQEPGIETNDAMRGSFRRIQSCREIVGEIAPDTSAACGIAVGTTGSPHMAV